MKQTLNHLIYRVLFPGHAKTLADLRDTFKGRRCFILGNGPSLKKTDLTRLNGEYVFCVNRGYKALEMGLARMSFFVVSDRITYLGSRAEIDAAPADRRFYRRDILSFKAGDAFKIPKGTIVFDCHSTKTMNEGYFTTDPAKPLRRGYTVVLDCVQLAYGFGFDEVYILGVDLDYSKADTHFYGTGQTEQARRDIMPMKNVFKAFEVAGRVFEKDGRKLLNASKGGKLDAIERIDYDRDIVFKRP
ncbi:MAG: 6-hydroxymethylpterin diphosphokinase MptE-like protein [Pseudomonadota bacterium]|nr:6-hydroxymethylpterin diphosphokinase MptE-like protein [Pseudomonadota bacterium]